MICLVGKHYFFEDHGISNILNNPTRFLMKLQNTLITLSFFAVVSLQAQTVSGILEADTYLRESASSTNFGSADQMLVGNVTNDRFHGLLRFDLANVTALGTLNVDYTIDSVSLTGAAESAGSGLDFNLELYEYGFDFVETSATWASPATGDATVGGTFGGTALSTVNIANGATFPQTIVFADTAAFQTSIENALADGSINFLLRRDITTGARFMRFQQDDGTNLAPFDLTINYTLVPEPSAYALLSGMLALGWIMGRRRR